MNDRELKLTCFSDRRAKQEANGATTQTQANFDALKSQSSSTAGRVSREASQTAKKVRTAAEEAADTAVVSCHFVYPALYVF
jgi:hypothetical protein